MDGVLRALAIYGFLLLVMRITGKRSLASITTFDLILLLIISEATQQAMLGDDFSLTNAIIVILTLVAIDIGLSLATHRWRRLDKVLSGVPIVIVENGRPLEPQMSKNRINIEDVMEEARKLQGVERMDQIKYAVLERSGDISIIKQEA